MNEFKMMSSELQAAYAAGMRDFSGANLSGAYLSGANLSDANLRDAFINWTQPELVAELLLQATGNETHLPFIGVVALSRRMNWCWDNFPYEQVDRLSIVWAKRVLVEYVKKDDYAPAALKRAWRRLKAAE